MQGEITATSLRAESLISRYRGLICDLDGVVYRGAQAVPDAIETLNHLTTGGVPVAFATNNASRPPEDVGDHLRELGIAAQGWSVVTSSQAAAAHLAETLDRGTAVFAVGGPGVGQALEEAGLTPIRIADLDDARVGAVVQGLGFDVTWRELAAVGHLVQAGAIWVATNVDPTLPTPNGHAPGNGALVAAVQLAAGTSPHVVGKPQPALLDLARARLGTDQADTLMCGDRLDTDIAGANSAGLDSLFVLTGSSRLQDLAFAEPAERPTYVTADLAGLLTPVPPLRSTARHLANTTPEAVLVDAVAGNEGELLRSVVSSTWDSLDSGRSVSRDADLWEKVEGHLGLLDP